MERRSAGVFHPHMQLWAAANQTRARDAQRREAYDDLLQ
jgi:hypothetical protein